MVAAGRGSHGRWRPAFDRHCLRSLKVVRFVSEILPVVAFRRRNHLRHEGRVWGRRIPGARIKHRVKENWLKMYDKAGSVLRVEMVSNNPEEFKVRKKVTRKNRRVLERVSMRKGVAYLFRYLEVSRQANYRYLEALAVVDDPTPAMQHLDDITARKKTASGRGVRAFNPLSRDDIQLFKAVSPKLCLAR